MKKEKKSKKATMADVAKMVGVSKTTVSRYLHGDYDFMSEETREKIKEAVETLNYRVNRLAQGLKSDRSGSIGVSIADIGNPFSSMLMKGIQNVCREHNYQLLLTDSNNSDIQERENIEFLMDSSVDGIILNSTGCPDNLVRDFSKRRDQVPFVLLDRVSQEKICDCISTNNKDVVKELLIKLQEQQYHYFVFVSEKYEGISTRTARIEAVNEYREQSSSEGEILIVDQNLRDEAASEVQNIVERHGNKKICFLANNEEILRVLMECFQNLNLYPGKEAGLCAFADKKTGRYSLNGITCIDQHPFLMGQRSAELLMKRIREEQTGDFIYEEVPAEICFYESTQSLG